MPATFNSRLKLLLELLKIPSISESESEDLAAQFIYNKLKELRYFQEKQADLLLVPTPLECDQRPLHTVSALVRARKKTSKTVILMGHYDVVNISVYGTLQEYAFEPELLQRHLDPQGLEPEVLADYNSGNYLFARGSMDMKAGICLEMEILRDFAENRDLYSVNLLFIAVPDEENASAGMRGAISHLAKLQQEEGLDYLAAINTEPSEAGRPAAKGSVIFLGTVGKLMPVFFCVGKESHVGNYYEGLNAGLLSSFIHTQVEVNPELADPIGSDTCPSWICLEHKLLKKGYSVTVPNRSVIYFNCYATTKTPADILTAMHDLASEASRSCLELLQKSGFAMKKMGYPCSLGPKWQLPVYKVCDIQDKAVSRLGKEDFDLKIKTFIQNSPKTDLRDLSIALLEKMIDLAEIPAPYIVIGFLPPYYPPRTSYLKTPKNIALLAAAENLQAEAKECFDIKTETVEYFTGLCDLSYFGFQGKADELSALADNMPGWEKIYHIDIQNLLKLDVPIINFGPTGHDAHRNTERLELKYSLEQLPLLLEFLINSIATENKNN